MTYQEFIEKTVTDWTHEVVRQRISAVTKNKLIASGELKKILGEIVRGAIKDGARMELFMRQYGRIQDMKNIPFSDRTPIDVIVDWIKAKGIDKFKRKYVRIYGKLPSSNERFVHQLAWSIKSGKKKQRRRRWYSRGIYGAIYALYDELLIGLADPALENLKKPLHGS